MTEKQRTSEVKNLLAGGFGGICTVVSGHPFDTIKVGNQNKQRGGGIFWGGDVYSKTDLTFVYTRT